MSKLKERLDQKTIIDIEKELKALKGNILTNQEKFYSVLEYLEITKRFKENPVYKTSTFEQYIGDMFMLRRGTYDSNRIAYTKHLDTTKEFGPRLVSSVRKKCGVLEAEKVFGEIKSQKDKKKGGFRRDDIQNIVKKHAKPFVSSGKKKNGVISDQKGLIDQLQRQHAKDQATIKAQADRIKELETQNEKLKTSLEFYKKQFSMPLGDFIQPPPKNYAKAVG